MAIETLVAGHYTGTYNAVAFGFSQSGFELTQETKAEVVNQTDAYGDSIIDLVHRGGSVYIMFESKVFKPGAITPFYPWGALGVMYTAAAPLGRLGSAVASSLVLTGVASTPAQSTGGSGLNRVIASLTASKAILPPDSNLKLLFDSKVRNVPIRLLCLPTDDGSGIAQGNGTWFTTT